MTSVPVLVLAQPVAWQVSQPLWTSPAYSGNPAFAESWADARDVVITPLYAESEVVRLHEALQKIEALHRGRHCDICDDDEVEYSCATARILHADTPVDQR